MSRSTEPTLSPNDPREAPRRRGTTAGAPPPEMSSGVAFDVSSDVSSDISSAHSADRPSHRPTPGPAHAPACPAADADARPIGELLRETRGLDDAQVAQIVAYQQIHGVRFGEAAMALRLAGSDDVVTALSRQFDYPYPPGTAEPGAAHELVAAASPFSHEAEKFRGLRSQLLMGVLAQAPRRALAVLSADIADGRTYVAANLAVAFSQLGGRTLLIDADMRTPRLHRLLDVDATVGLSSVLSGRTESQAVRPVPGLPSLSLMPAGPVPPNPLELLQRPGFSLLVDEMLHAFDHVVIDTPAAVHGTDARVIAARSVAALVVGRTGHSRLAAVRALVDGLTAASARIAGVVMNDY